MTSPRSPRTARSSLTLLARGPRGLVPAALGLAALALAPSVGAQELPLGDDPQAAQEALRDRWRPSVDLGLRLSINERVSLEREPFAEEAPLAPAASVGVSLFRAVLPGLDLGGRLGLVVPQRSELRYASATQSCPADYVLSFDGTPEALGGTLDATAGLRARVFGAATPFHLTAGVGVGLRAVSPQGSDRWQCRRYDPGGGYTQAPTRGEARGFGVYPALAGYLGYESHFGAREQFGFGTEVWFHHDGMISSSVVFRLLWTPSSGPSLPDAARSRGTRTALWTVVTTGAVIASGLLLVAFATGGSHAG